LAAWYSLVAHAAFGVDFHGKYPSEKISVFEYGLIVLITLVGAMILTHQLNALVTSLFARAVDRLSAALCAGKCAEVEVGEGVNGSGSVLDIVRAAIKELTMLDVEPSTALRDCGFDSFGTGALVASLNRRFPGARLSAMMLLQGKDLAELARKVEERIEIAKGDENAGTLILAAE